MWIGIAMFLFLLQELPLFKARWVEDESWYAIPAYTLLHEGRLRNPTSADSGYSAMALKPPAMALTLYAAFRSFGEGLVQARFPSLLAGLLLIPVVYLLGTALVGRAAGAAAALVVSTDNFLFVAGRTARPEIYVALFGTIAFLLWAWSRRVPGFWLPLLAGLSAGVAINYHVNGIAIAVSITLLILIDCRYRFWRESRFLAFCFGAGITLIPFAVWIQSSPSNYAAFKHEYGRGSSMTIEQKIEEERWRYADFVGASSQRIPLPFHIPYRLHIAVVIVASVILLYCRNRAFAFTGLVALAPSLLWFLYLVNKTPRYFAVVAPCLAILIGAAAFATWQAKRFRRFAGAVVLIVVITQLIGNAMLIRKSADADYSSVATQLQRLIPRGSSAYGAITFWFALRDRTFYSYNRIPLKDAVATLHPSYMILKDRVMMVGEGNGVDTWAALRKDVQGFVEHHGSLIGRVSSRFYGDLEVFAVHYENLSGSRDASQQVVPNGPGLSR
jgi:4-amino-4-deoxy-L-arabinose transferase-like glycosyltransferase